MSDHSSWVEKWQGWVERRNRCNIDHVYTDLRETVEQDVEKMNGILKENSKRIDYSVDDSAGEAKRFSVNKSVIAADGTGHMASDGCVRFCVLENRRIEVSHYNDILEPPKHLFTVTCEWDDQAGRCIILCEYKAENVDAVGTEEVVVESAAQISEGALGEFFFGFKMIGSEM